MTEYIYAVLNDNGFVENIIVSDNPNAVEALFLLIPTAKEIILTSEETKPAYIGGDMVDGKFRMPQPYPSWVWNEDSWQWDSPVPYPEGGNGYTWDEETVSWIEIPPITVSD